MPKIKLTRSAIDRITAPSGTGKQVLWWDTELRGFGLLASGTTTAKSYIVQRRLGAGGPLRRVTLDQIGEYQRVEDARLQAGQVLNGLRNGIDPKAERRKAAERDKTLGYWLDAYLAA